MVIEEPHAQLIRDIYRMYLELGSVGELKAEVDRRGWVTPRRPTRGPGAGERCFSRGHLYRILVNAIHIGRIVHRGVPYQGQHPAIIRSSSGRRGQARCEHRMPGWFNCSPRRSDVSRV